MQTPRAVADAGRSWVRGLGPMSRGAGASFRSPARKDLPAARSSDAGVWVIGLRLSLGRGNTGAPGI